MIPTLYPTFRKWSEKGSVYIISDNHLNDKDREVMGYTFTEIEQMEALTKKCHKNDTLIHLGDVGKPELFMTLKCHKVLIMGNHDEAPSRYEKYFDEIYTGPLWIAEKLVLSHEPLCLESGITRRPIAFNIHGHDHSGEYYNDDFHLNMAQNLSGVMPLNWKEFIKDGFLKRIKSIHRETIDTATARKRLRNE